jgi:hypothetical protein
MDSLKGAVMVQLTSDQALAVHGATQQPATILDPTTNETYVLLPKAVYERFRDLYDSSPWTDEEMDLLAGEDADSLGWEGMNAYQEMDP